MKGPWDLPTDPLLALRAGDSRPFEAFVRAGVPALLAFFGRLGVAHEEAEDLVQDVFLKLYQHAPRYRGEERFRAFCLRVAKNVWIDRGRRRGARPKERSLGPLEDGDDGPGVAETLASPAPGPVERAAVREDAGRLREAVAALPEGQRLVFELGVLQELSYAEIGSILTIPTGTVKSRMFHAVRKLRELLTEETT